MSDLRFFLGLARPDRWWLRLGAALAALTLLAGIGLLSLSGWFITASAVAGRRDSLQTCGVSWTATLTIN